MKKINDSNGKIAHYVFASLDLEDKVSSSVYGQYLARDVWPDDITDEEFKVIQTNINTLIAETESHKKAFSLLKDNISNAV